VLRGTAFIIMWHDIAGDGEEDYHHWHSKQHMVERLSHPGFKRSRRGVNWGLDRQRYFTLYEGESLETFVSDEYMGSLNNPTPWTSQVAPHFRNFLRSACEVAYSVGKGVGGALATFRSRLPTGHDEEVLLSALRPHLEALRLHPKISGLHLAFARPDFSNTRTKETDIRPAMSEAGFDFVVIVESYGVPEIESLAPEITARLESIGAQALLPQAYEMAYTLEDSDVNAEEDPRVERPVEFAPFVVAPAHSAVESR
jgi:hypothetical protein